MKTIHYYNKIFFNNYDLIYILAVPTQYKINKADPYGTEKIRPLIMYLYIAILQIAHLFYDLWKITSNYHNNISKYVKTLW